MKRIVIAVLFFILSFVISIYALNKTENKCNSLINELEEIIELTSREKSVKNNKEIKNSVIALNDDWENEKDIFNIFLNNSDFKGIELNIKKMKTHSENGDINSVYLCATEALEEVNYLEDSIFPTINNIF